MRLFLPRHLSTDAFVNIQENGQAAAKCRVFISYISSQYYFVFIRKVNFVDSSDIRTVFSTYTSRGLRQRVVTNVFQVLGKIDFCVLFFLYAPLACILPEGRI